MIFIGWSGRARHGKTESTDAVRCFATKMQQSVGVYDVGDMIRRVAIATGRLPQVERKDMTAAQLQVLIDIGKEMRAVDSNYWLNRILVQAAEDNFDLAMCPNVRLPQEAQSIRDAGGVIVRVTRLNDDGSIYISPDRNPNDTTETALEFWPADYYLTAKTTTDAALVRMQAVTLYRYLAFGFKEENL